MRQSAQAPHSHAVLLTTLLGSYYSCAHFADGEMETWIGPNSCKVAELTAEPELLSPPRTHLKSSGCLPEELEQDLGGSDDGSRRGGSELEAEHWL